MNNGRFFGINFLSGSDKAIASISVFNSTNSVYIGPSGSETTLHTYRLVDCYLNSATYGTYERSFVYWIALSTISSYEITVENSGSYSTLSTTPRDIAIQGYLEIEPLVPAEFSADVVLSNSDLSYSKVVRLTSDVQTDLAETYAVAASGTNDTFTIVGTSSRADEFTRIGILASGATVTDWYWPTDPEIESWGSVTPYTDLTISSVAQFGVVFAASPSIGTVFIEYIPRVDTAHIQAVISQPYLGTYIDDCLPVRVQDWVCEFIN